MKAMTCSSFRDEMTREWCGITTRRGSTEALTRWSAAEPALAGFAGLAEVVDAIAVPIGQSYDASLEIAQAVIRVAVGDILARRLMLQVMAPILSKECFKSSQLLRAQGVVVEDGRPDAETLDQLDRLRGQRRRPLVVGRRVDEVAGDRGALGRDGAGHHGVGVGAAVHRDGR